MTTAVATKVIRIDVIASAQAQANIKALAADMKKVSGTAEEIKSKMSDGFGSILGTFNRIRGALAGLGLSVGVVELGRQIITTAENYKVLETRLRVFLGSQMAANDAMGEVLRIARETGKEIDGVAKLYEKVARAGQQFGFSQSQVTKVTEAFSQSLRVSGATAQEAFAAQVQFGQALASGRLQGDEFRSLAENNAFFVYELAKSIGVTTTELRKMGSEGKLNTQLLLDAFFKLSKDGTTLLDRINQTAEKIPLTFKESLESVKTSVTELVGEMGKLVTGSQGGGSLFQQLSEYIHGVAQEVKQLGQEADAVNKGPFGRWLDVVGLISSKLGLLGGPLGSAIGLFHDLFSEPDPEKRLQKALKGAEDRLAELLKQYNATAAGFNSTGRGAMEIIAHQKIFGDLAEKIKAARDEITNLKNLEAERFFGPLMKPAIGVPRWREPIKPVTDDKPAKETDFDRALERMKTELAELKAGTDDTNKSLFELFAAVESGKIKLAGGIKGDQQLKVLMALAEEIDYRKELIELEKEMTKEREKEAEAAQKLRQELILATDPNAIFFKARGDYAKEAMDDLNRIVAIQEKVAALDDLIFDPKTDVRLIPILEQIRDKLLGVKPAAETAKKSVDEFQKVLDRSFIKALDSAADAIADFVMGTTKSFSALVESVLRDVLKLLIKEQIVAFIKTIKDAVEAKGGLTSILSSAWEWLKKIFSADGIDANPIMAMLRSLGKMLADLAAQASASSIGGFFGNLFGGGGGFMTNTGLEGMSPTDLAGYFAKGGIMTSGGPIPLRKYDAGGIANSPQMAVYGEGKTPEAYVPLPDGRSIPVTVTNGGNGGLIINVYNQGEPVEVSGVEQRRTNRGTEVDIMLDKIRASLAQDVRSGRGIAPVMESQYGLRRVNGLAR